MSKMRTHPVYLATIAIERHRWGSLPGTRFSALKPFYRGHPVVPAERAAVWMDRALTDGFDGVELFEPHAFFASDAELERLAAHPLSVAVFNTYCRFDEPDPTWRDAVAAMAKRLHAGAVKYNLAAAPESLNAQCDALRRFADRLPPQTRLFCECHTGSGADTPETAAALADRLTDARFGFMVHVAEPLDRLAAWVRTLGDRLAHAHVWMRPEADREVPLEKRVRHLRTLGYRGSFSVEFTRGVRWGEPDPDAETLYREAVADLIAIRSGTATE